MEGMEVTYQLKIADVKTLEKHFSMRRENRTRQRFIVLLVCLALVIPTAIFFLSYTRTPQFQTNFAARGVQVFSPLLFAAFPLVTFIGLWLLAPVLGKHFLKKSPLLQQPITLRVDKSGIHGQFSALWPQVQAIEETLTHIFVVFEPNQTFIIPKRAFASAFEATQFAAKCRGLWANAK